MNVGEFGEEYTAKYLLQKGYHILKRNYHSRWGEIDIIATDGNYLAFVEVKTRRESCGENPAVFVDNKKQKKIVLTAQKFLLENEDNEIAKLQPRFDVAALTIGNNQNKKIIGFDYFKDSFC